MPYRECVRASDGLLPVSREMSSLIDFVDMSGKDPMLYVISCRMGENFCVATQVTNEDCTVSSPTASNQE